MIKIIIVEDEIPARKKLQTFIKKIDRKTEIIAECDTIKALSECLSKNPEADLIISDIELKDGNVFDVYKKFDLRIPIIFCTAYNDFWQNAFEMSGIEYLLKPYSFSRFQQAIEKYYYLISKNDQNPTIEQFKLLLDLQRNASGKKIPIKKRQEIYFLQPKDIVFFEAEEGVIFGHEKTGEKHLLNLTSLTVLEEKYLDNEFYKINRSQIVNKAFIEKLSRYTKNTMAIHTPCAILQSSQSTTAAFNKWMGL